MIVELVLSCWLTNQWVEVKCGRTVKHREIEYSCTREIEWHGKYCFIVKD
jgi:hypothetical protein